MSAAIAPPIVARPAHTSNDIKRKFCNTIGIDRSSSSDSYDQSCAADADSIHQRRQTDITFQEKLKCDHQHGNTKVLPRGKTFGSIRRTGKSRTSKKAKSLTFHEMVEVFLIPMRTEYSTCIRSRLWSSATELHENAGRNTLEFASEGWNWRNVVEDERMYVCSETAELIHPFHYDRGWAFTHGFR